MSKGCNGEKGGKDAGPARMQRAYDLGGAMLREKLRKESPEDLAYLERVAASDLIVVRGRYDRVELVLDALGTRCTMVDPGSVERLRLRPEQMLVINCPGQISPRGVAVVKAFVEGGGTLFTTDWALKHVLEPAFPGILAFNGRPTADDVVRIEVCSPESRFISDLVEAEADPQWWLEASSYPIRILAPETVEVLVRSKELGEKYGEAPVAVRFRWGQGEVYHMISHYYLQRSELRTARHAAPAAKYATAIGVPGVCAATTSPCDDLTSGEVESAVSSMQFIGKVIADKQRRTGRNRME